MEGSPFLPLPKGMVIDQVQITETQLTVIAISTRPEAACPGCGCLSEQVHSQYQRTLRDVSCGGRSVILRLSVRKFFCRQPTCSRRVFTERLPRVVAPYARRTKRLTEVVRLLAFVLGGEPGARIVERLGMTTSPATVSKSFKPEVAPKCIHDTFAGT